jgi:hypothetical protein
MLYGNRIDHRDRLHAAGFSMVGMLITMACIVVLFAIMMTSLNKATTGQGSQQENTVRSFEDKMYLSALYTSMLTNAGDNKGRFLTPSEMMPKRDPTLNTTANVFSAMIAQNYTTPKQLISGNEYSPNVWEMENYDFTAYDPRAGVLWDKRFQADLNTLSNTSFAHVPLFGKRLEQKWNSTMDSRTAMLGNRGPKDGIANPLSATYGRDGAWRGHIVFADAHVEFIDVFTPNGMTATVEGKTVPDNIFHMEEGPNGLDTILAFTLKMLKNGPELQYD